MLGDECFSIRKEAIDIIVDIRSCSDDQNLNYFLPKVNFEAVHFRNLCSMSKKDGRWVYLTFLETYEFITEPPLTIDLDLSNFLVDRFTSDLPCHTQSVERLVKVTTNAFQRG